MANRKYSMFFDDIGTTREFNEVLKDVQEHISSKFGSLISENPKEQKKQICIYIEKYLSDNNILVDGYNIETLTERLYSEMAEFSFLTEYLSADNIEEININSWKDVKITYNNGEILPSKEHFNSPKHAIDVIRRLLHQSGMILDYSKPLVRGHLSNKIRITVIGPPIIDDNIGVTASIRIVNPKQLGREDFIKSETVTEEMVDFLELSLRYGLSMCVTGATGSGKTTVMAYLLSTIPDHLRKFTIENGTREFDLVKEDNSGNVLNSVVHTVTRSSDDEKQNVSQEDLLEYALTFNPDLICVGEMKSSEAYAAQEAARTGHGVITTTHANSCFATYNRMVTLCKTKYDIDNKTLYDLVTEAFPIIVFAKKLEDSSRKIMEITECEILLDGTRKIHTLFRFNITETIFVDGKPKINGHFEKVNSISKSLQVRLAQNGLPSDIIDKLVGTEEKENKKVGDKI